jgi:hypothetical protein
MDGVHDWVRILQYENLPRSPRPQAALQDWLRERGIDWMPIAPERIRIDLACGPDAEGRMRGWYTVSVRADELRRYGLHPDVPFG